MSIPAQGTAAAGSWTMTGVNVPIALNSFYASTQDRLTIVNGTGQNSSTTNDLSGSIQGSFVGTGLSAAILGYAIARAEILRRAPQALLTGTLARDSS